jgi:hypothetical protein
LSEEAAAMPDGNRDEGVQYRQELGMEQRKRRRPASPLRRFLSRVLLGLFSAGWVVTAAIAGFWQTIYITRLHELEFSQQTPPKLNSLDVEYRFYGEMWQVVSLLWLAAVLFVWAWKFAAHIERTKTMAKTLRDALEPEPIRTASH